MLKKGHTSGKKTDVTVEIDVLWLVSVIITVLMCVFSLYSAMRIFSSFMGVSRFEIKGETDIYQAGDLAAGAGLKRGDKLFRLDTDELEKKLLVNCAYLKEVDIKRVFPNKIVFVIECHDPVWYVEISGDFYVLDAELNVLEETANEGALREMDLIKLTLPRVKSAIVDDVLTFGDGEEEIKETERIMELILSSRAIGMICSADIDNRYDIHFEFDKIVQGSDENYLDIDEVFLVSIGGYSKLDVKLEYIVKALLREDLAGVVGGSIDVSEIGNRVSIRPSFSPSKPEEEESEEEESVTTDVPQINDTPGVAG